MGDAFICQAYGITEMSGGVASLVLGGDIFSVGTVSTGVQMKVSLYDDTKKRTDLTH